MRQPGSFLLNLFFSIGVTSLVAQTQIDGGKNKVVIDDYGAIIRGDLSKKQLAVVFTGDEFADGAGDIRQTLKKHNAKASFFLTGNFYSNPGFKSIIKDLKKDGHYLGAHSDKHLLYADWTKRDSLLVTQEVFNADLENNYRRMEAFGIKKAKAVYFIPPYEWYNATIAMWTSDLNLRLVNFSPGTRSTADYTYPGMGPRYRPSDEIHRSIMDYEAQNANGLNGFILLIHIGTDPRRTDKFYHLLDKLLTELESKGYSFLRIDDLLN